MPSKAERAWVAGMIDADGCVTLRRPTPRSYAPQIVVDNTDHEILDELVRLYGGSLVVKKSRLSHHRQAWSWRLYGAANILGFLREILPFMHCQTKIQRARLLVREYPSITPRNGKYDPDTLARKHSFAERFMAIGSGRGSQNRPN